MIRKHNISILLLALTGVLSACTKDTTPKSLQGPKQDYGRLPFVVEDNYTYSLYYQALVASGYSDTLASQAGPFTILVPNNDAMAEGYFAYSNNTVNYLLQASNPPLNDYVRYLIIPQAVSFKSLPIGANQQFPTLEGTPVYLTKYITGGDTVITVNGIPVVANGIDIPASNGSIDVLTSVPEPQLYANLWQRMLNDGSLALFTTAAQRAGLQSFFESQDQSLTVLAPSNTAFVNMYVPPGGLDLTTASKIAVADPGQLKTLLLYHVLKGRFFTNDLVRIDTLSAQGDSVLLSMYNGGTIKYTQGQFYSNGLVPGLEPVLVNGHYVYQYIGPPGPAMASWYSEYEYDIPAVTFLDRATGNGVLQEITSVLYP